MTRKMMMAGVLALLCTLGFLLAGCSSDRGPTAPDDTTGTPAPPTTAPPPGGAGSLVITLTADPSTLQPNLAGGDAQSSIISVCVRRQDGTPVPNGSTVTLTTTFGYFNTQFGPSAVILSLQNGCSGALFIAPAEEGTAVITASISDASRTITIPITDELSTFGVNFVTPNSGPPQGGTVVEIHGSGFEAPMEVEFCPTATSTFSCIQAQVVSVSPDVIVVITPSITQFGLDPTVPQVFSIIVRKLSTGEQSELDNAFTYTPSELIPEIFSVSPSAGSNDGGTRVTIFGTGFQFPLQVFFGTSPANRVEAQVVSITPNQMVVITPPAYGQGHDIRSASVFVELVNPQTGQRDQLVNAFRYGPTIRVTDVVPDRGPFPGGNLVTIYGQGFDEPLSVKFCLPSGGCVQQQVISVTATEIVIRTQAPVTTNCGSPSGFFTVTLIDNGDTATAIEGFIFEVADVFLAGLSPAQGTAGTVITITGAGFSSPMRVRFSDGTETIEVFATVLSPTTATVVAPNFPLLTVACDVIPGPPAGTQLAPRPVDIAVVLSATGCEDELSDAFTFLPPTPNPCVGDCSLFLLTISPNSGRSGQTVTLSGQNFSSPMRVTFRSGGSVAETAATVLSPTSATVLVPNFPLATTTCDDIPGGNSGTRFVNTAADVSVTTLNDACTDTLEGGFTFLPPATNPCVGDTAPTCPGVTVSATGTPTAGPDGQVFTFAGTASGGTTFVYNWVFRLNGALDGTASGATVGHQFSGSNLTAGNDVGVGELTVTNECGSTATTNAVVTICPVGFPCP